MPINDSEPLVTVSTDSNTTFKTASLIAVLGKHFLPLLSLSWTLGLVASLQILITPLLQFLLITHVESQRTDNPEPLWKGILYCFCFFLFSSFSTLVFNAMFTLYMKCRTRVRATLIAAVYKKALRLSADARQKSSTGEIVNLMSVDVERIAHFVYEGWVFIIVPIQICVVIYMLHRSMGNSIFAGVAILLVAAPVSFAIGILQRKIRVKTMKIKDERIKLLKEVLSSIKVIKLYAWEPSFQRKVTLLRKSEVLRQRTLNIIRAIQDSLYNIVPVLVAMTTFAIYTSTKPDHTLTASVAFVALSLFDTMKYSLNLTSQKISMLVMTTVSVTRLAKFFANEELDDTCVTLDPTAVAAIEILDGEFSHLQDSSPVLHDIHLQVTDKSLTAIVGSVGSGKSSLLSAVTGDLHKLEGSVIRKGSLALVSQVAFIVNASVKNNILFGNEYNEELYSKVVDACALVKDFEVLPNGDNSIIGEKGINISGGQKQRISLARAVYSNADIYLLDDPLSAVDVHVGKHIFEHVIGPSGLLKDKTRLMVTHGLHWLPQVDEIYVMDTGRLTEHGSYKSLISRDGVFAKLLKEYSEEASEKSKPEGQGKLQKDLTQRKCEQLERAANNKNMQGETVGAKEEVTSGGSDLYDEQEQVATGNVTWSIYWVYLKALGLKMVSICALCMLGSTGLDLTYSIWISKWTGDEVFQNSSQASADQKESAMERYLIILSFIGLGQMLTVLSYTLLAAYCFCQASSNLHKSLLNNILKAKILFFEIKPLGMILNRFSKDVDIVDNQLGWSLLQMAVMLVGLLVSIGGIIYTTPLFTLAVIPTIAVYVYVQRYYIATSRQLIRLLSKASSPIYAHFSETLNGCQTIRAYGHQERFMNDNINKIEKQNIFQYFDEFADCWLDVRMYTLNGVLLCLTALFCVLSVRIPSLHMTSSLTGLVLSLVIEVADVMTMFVWTVSTVETNIVSIERIKEYIEVEKEDDCSSDLNPESDWPSAGKLEFDNYSTRYRPELDLAIKHLSITIKPEEKVGVVGRTGAGKSSLSLSLFRMLEAENGCIKVDGVDISQLGLHRLRNSLTILPQDPMLFSGTVRENLDPFAESSDEKLWNVLEQCELKSFISEQPEQLSAECGEGGQNLSVGQRQLLCLARALLRKTKVLIMDEATAAVDMKTDDVIQKTIRSKFSDCTVLTIAHRLHTIMDCDRIMVMSEGHVAEFDSPQVLLENKLSLFYSMAKEAGIVS
ncbi:multidrug resistance-associated protein 1-like [Watersipora subatra]|uniref:multidrug resistance-associated protein 1-like n=1 Tax=Watersipora subatra TaxID=2589382 RepID=UPI00355BB86B